MISKCSATTQWPIDLFYLLNTLTSMETIVLPNYSWGTLINRPDINCISSWTDQIWSDVNNLLNNCDVVVFNQVCSHGRAPLSASDSFVENLVALKAYFLFIVEDEKSVRRDFSDEKDIFQRLRYLYAISEFQRLDTLLQTLAIQIQQSVLKGDMDVVEQFVNVYIETKVFEMVYGNVLQCTRKYFGYVLPEKKLVRWFCLQFQNCPRVISLGNSFECFKYIVLLVCLSAFRGWHLFFRTSHANIFHSKQYSITACVRREWSSRARIRE